MTTTQFDKMYGELKDQLMEYMKNQKLTGSNFYEHMYKMCVSVRTQMMLIGISSLTGNQAYALMQLPDYVIMEITKPETVQ